MSSTPSPATGSRLNPWRIATSAAASTTKRRPSTSVTMSGRGTMTSRTTVSPNSMIDAMSSRSGGFDRVGLDCGRCEREQLLFDDRRARDAGPIAVARCWFDTASECLGDPAERADLEQRSHQRGDALSRPGRCRAAPRSWDRPRRRRRTRRSGPKAASGTQRAPHRSATIAPTIVADTEMTRQDDEQHRVEHLVAAPQQAQGGWLRPGRRSRCRASARAPDVGEAGLRRGEHRRDHDQSTATIATPRISVPLTSVPTCAQGGEQLSLSDPCIAARLAWLGVVRVRARARCRARPSSASSASRWRGRRRAALRPPRRPGTRRHRRAAPRHQRSVGWHPSRGNANTSVGPSWPM